MKKPVLIPRAPLFMSDIYRDLAKYFLGVEEFLFDIRIEVSSDPAESIEEVAPMTTYNLCRAYVNLEILVKNIDTILTELDQKREYIKIDEDIYQAARFAMFAANDAMTALVECGYIVDEDIYSLELDRQHMIDSIDIIKKTLSENFEELIERRNSNGTERT